MEITVARDVWQRHLSSNTKRKSVQRALCAWGQYTTPINVGVPPEECLPAPPQYKLPSKGEAAEAVRTASVALVKGRSLFIHGQPGSGKDAIVHAFSAAARIPGRIFTICPNTDISAWLYTRAFNATSTYWEEGALLKALRDGYTSPTGEVIPYLILLSDFDRADRSQAETLRLILDSIQGRIMGPDGVAVPVLEGTRIIATANSSGGGDLSGRMSSNMLDASLMDRFQVKVRFSWLTISEEIEIAASRYPNLFSRVPSARKQIGDTLTSIRNEIYSGKLECDFSARAISAWCQHMEDILDLDFEGVSGDDRIPGQAFRAVADGMPDEMTRLALRRLAAPHLTGMKI